MERMDGMKEKEMLIKRNPAKTDKRMETVDCEIREHVDCSRLARLYLSPEAGCCYCSYRPLAVGGSGMSRVQESMRGFWDLTKRKWGGGGDQSMNYNVCQRVKSVVFCFSNFVCAQEVKMDD